ncbi:MAG: type II toxin-antitoxin system RelE/ParE family toxin [Cyclobacteriaceae bacterium]|nr:type II toxin-antitoxin system RelE/ParE family toxin [Cyclobacteriaceae bacterium]
MAKQVIWSARTQRDRKQILSFWNVHNQSTTYSKTLDRKFREAIKLIGEFPQIGKRTDDAKARIKIVRDYFLIYEETETKIILLTIWDSRQDPKNLERILNPPTT